MCRDSHGGVWVLSQSEKMSDFQLRCGNVAFGPTCCPWATPMFPKAARRAGFEEEAGSPLGTSLLNWFILGGGGDTGSCVVWSGFTLAMWLRVTLNSLPPGPRDDRVKPLSRLWRQILNYSFS